MRQQAIPAARATAPPPAAIRDRPPLAAEQQRLWAENARLRAERAALAAFAATEPTDDRAANLDRLAAAAATALAAPSAALLLYSPPEHDGGVQTIEAAFAGYAAPAEARLRARDCPPDAVPTEQLAIATGRPVIAIVGPDDRSRPRPDPAADPAHLLVVPIVRTGRVGGCLRVERPLDRRPFDHHDASFSVELAALLALLIGRAEGYAAAQRRAVRADALREIGRELSAELDLDRFCATASRHLTRLMDVRDCWIGLWDAAAGELAILLYICDGARRDEFNTLRVRPEEARGLACALLTERRTIHVPDYLLECQRRGLAAITLDGDWRGLAWIGVPLVSGGRLIGAMAVERFGGTFSLEEATLLEALAGHLAAALENARLFAELRALALADPLTGLANHRHAHERLADALAGAAARGEPLAVAMLDLNHFKRYNDTYGHQVGDALLRAVAAVLREESPPGGLAGRYGGDEFVLVLPGFDRAEAEAVLDRIRGRLRTAAVATTPGDQLLVTTSGGVASYPADAATAHDLIALADAALYREKRARHAERR